MPLQTKSNPTSWHFPIRLRTVSLVRTKTLVLAQAARVMPALAARVAGGTAAAVHAALRDVGHRSRAVGAGEVVVLRRLLVSIPL